MGNELKKKKQFILLLSRFSFTSGTHLYNDKCKTPGKRSNWFARNLFSFYANCRDCIRKILIPYKRGCSSSLQCTYLLAHVIFNCACTRTHNECVCAYFAFCIGNIFCILCRVYVYFVAVSQHSPIHLISVSSYTSERLNESQQGWCERLPFPNFKF